jgi:hypothetical protein
MGNIIISFILNPPVGLIIVGLILVFIGQGGIGGIIAPVGIVWLIIRTIYRKKAMGNSNTQKWKCNAAGNLPADAETKAFEILQNVIDRNGVTSDFKILRTFVERKNSALKVWGTRYKSSKEEEIRLFFLIGHSQDYTDLNGKTKNGEICAIEFDFYFLETSKESALSIGNEAEQEIKKYLSSSGLTLHQ